MNECGSSCCKGCWEDFATNEWLHSSGKFKIIRSKKGLFNVYAWTGHKWELRTVENSLNAAKKRAANYGAKLCDKYKT